MITKFNIKNIKIIPIILCGLFLSSGCSKSNNSSLIKYSSTNPSINDIENAISSHQISCTAMILNYLNRIYSYDLNTDNNLPPINAISAINPAIFDEASRLDKLYATSKEMPGKLFCIPVIVKDNVDVLGMETTSGSYALLGTMPIKDSILVKQLKSENAIIIAKSAMDELAMGASGFSSLNGRIGNPYNTLKSPGGSSGGTGAAISSNFAVIGIGTDNSGSVRVPAAFNGIYGIRPTQGLINKSGIFPMGNIDGTPGPMARSITDLAISLNIIQDSSNKTDYTKFLVPNQLSGKNIAILHTAGKYDLWNNMSPEVKAIYDQAITNLVKSGVKIIKLDLPKFNNNRTNNMAGTIDDVNQYLSDNLGSRNSLQDICLSGRTRVMGNEKSCLKMLNNLAQKNTPQYKNAFAIIKHNLEYITQIMQNQHLDGIIIPISKSGSSTYDLKQLNTWQPAISSNSGMPSIVIQIGHTSDQMPVAMEIVGKQFDEGILINIAYNYEEQFLSFVPPTLIANTKVNNYSIQSFNNIISQIGKMSFLEYIKPNNKNNITPEQSFQVTTEVFKNLEVHI